MTQNPPPTWDSPATSEFRPVHQPGFGYSAPPQKQAMSPVLIVLLTVVVMLLIGLIALVAFLAVPRFVGTSAAPVTSTVSATVTAPVATAEPTVRPARPAPGVAPSGANECVDAGSGSFSSAAAGSSQTSCAFAASVRSTYLGEGGGGGSMLIDAYSPVTGSTYTMSCSGGAVVTCSGGNNAVVYIY